MTLIHLATQNRARPSELLGIEDDYTAYCLDETCLFMVNQARDGRSRTLTGLRGSAESGKRKRPTQERWKRWQQLVSCRRKSVKSCKKVLTFVQP